MRAVFLDFRLCRSCPPKFPTRGRSVRGEFLVFRKTWKRNNFWWESADVTNAESRKGLFHVSFFNVFFFVSLWCNPSCVQEHRQWQKRNKRQLLRIVDLSWTVCLFLLKIFVPKEMEPVPVKRKEQKMLPTEATRKFWKGWGEEGPLRVPAKILLVLIIFQSLSLFPCSPNPSLSYMHPAIVVVVLDSTRPPPPQIASCFCSRVCRGLDDDTAPLFPFVHHHSRLGTERMGKQINCALLLSVACMPACWGYLAHDDSSWYSTVYVGCCGFFDMFIGKIHVLPALHTLIWMLFQCSWGLRQEIERKSCDHHGRGRKNRKDDLHSKTLFRSEWPGLESAVECVTCAQVFQPACFVRCIVSARTTRCDPRFWSKSCIPAAFAPPPKKTRLWTKRVLPLTLLRPMSFAKELGEMLILSACMFGNFAKRKCEKLHWSQVGDDSPSPRLLDVHPIILLYCTTLAKDTVQGGGGFTGFTPIEWANCQFLRFWSQMKTFITKPHCLSLSRIFRSPWLPPRAQRSLAYAFCPLNLQFWHLASFSHWTRKI